ncbi:MULTISPECIES: ABC transporter ATP-binding protein [Bacillus]|uniref:ABC transporter ATP-binding protein n=1 Tax=Bacillus cereus TaxID=1396 RepID=A0A2C1LD99_BACCE|nr:MULTISPECIES: ABC transporter ATP-binding protein [Bacillus]MDH4424000.1 ABC transporter ATP-binding protein [Bacillus cereus]PER22511.1 ABC transporter ATP-binding protein [Bacillus cereus]PFA61911.1 ABC transporter ATP-binding protein [Bacillus sp. AFS015896]PGL82317.1 ABC transporter ATP-binding protein [Bacillus sp. AFS054943]PGU02906.1 ABC transporter ATP-binding protein [Bacillus cereus]
MNEYVIKTRNLTKKHGKINSVNNLNLEVPEGSIYGFLGPNGAGKTTTIKMLLGLIKPSNGKIEIFNSDLLKNRSSILSKVGSLVESPSYYGHLSGYKNLEVIATMLDIKKSRIDEVLKLVRLTKEAQKPVKHYSLGMKQRLGIASALIGEPQLLILDEPTNGLDPSGIQEIRELIIEMPKRFGITVMVSSHLLSEINAMATHVGIINEGNLVFQNKLEVLQDKNKSQLYLEVGNPELAYAQLKNQGWEVDNKSNGLLVNSISRKDIAKIVESLVLEKNLIYKVNEQKRSLEDIFLNLTGKGQSL